MSARHALLKLLLAVIGVFWATITLRAAEQADSNATIALVPTEYRHRIVQQLSLAEGKREQWLSTIAKAPPEQREAVGFLLANMPERDLKSLDGDFLLRNVELAFRVRKATGWAAKIPEEIFLQEVLPYANLNERRDSWREDFLDRFLPRVKDCKSAGEAAQLLNREMFAELKVQYHATKRPKPDQSPYESMDAHFASCSGLSILLVDACRAVGIPARVAGTPLWSDGSGNHTWVEVWDGQWRFIGAAEPGPFNQTWFAALAAKADDHQPDHRIYAASFQHTDLPFILVWDPKSTEFSGVDVTGYYVHRQTLKVVVPPGTGASAARTIEVRQDGRLIAQSTDSDPGFELGAGSEYTVGITRAGAPALRATVQLRQDTDADVDFAASAVAPAARVATTQPGTLEGDWARMRGITPRGYVAGLIHSPMTIDGRADEPAWADAPWTDDFADIQGSSRPAPRFRTRAKLLWDEENLYIYAELEEPHVWGTITKKNEVIFKDNDFEVFISPTGDNHNYHEFEMNALNTIWELTLEKPYRNDGVLHDPQNIDGLRSAVHIDGTPNDPSDTDHSWSVEIAIPWKGLAQYAGERDCPPKDGQQWRMNFSRVEWLVDIINGKYRKIPREMRPEDNWVWSPQGVVDMHRPERWGFVQFSRSAPGAASFRADPTLAARDQLMEVYYREHEYQARNGRYARDCAELQMLSAAKGDNASEPIQIDVTGSGYTASLALTAAEGPPRVLHVREDSKLWASAAAAAEAPPTQPVDAVAGLAKWLALPKPERPELKSQTFASASLSKSQDLKARKLLLEENAADVRATLGKEWKDEAIVIADHTLRFKQRHFGTKPKDGWDLYISLHGGGGAPAQVNDQQWENQIGLYQPRDALYIAPRAPTDNWNLWHEPHMDPLLDRLLQAAFVLGEVNPNRVFIMGYSAGGDGVYQLAPRMADRWAAAAMMAGHPNDASPLGLRNIGFTIHVGALDNAYDRNKVAAKWGDLLDDLQKSDPNGYVHEVKLHEGRGHWMNLEDKVALDWMAKFTRNPFPDKVVWKQSPVTHDRFYWLAMNAGDVKAGQLVVASRAQQNVEIEKAEGVTSLKVMLNDAMLDLDQPVTITAGGKALFKGQLHRTIQELADTLAGRGDPFLAFDAEADVAVEAAK